MTTATPIITSATIFRYLICLQNEMFLLLLSVSQYMLKRSHSFFYRYMASYLMFCIQHFFFKYEKNGMVIQKIKCNKKKSQSHPTLIFYNLCIEHLHSTRLLYVIRSNSSTNIIISIRSGSKTAHFANLPYRLQIVCVFFFFL